MTDGLTSFEAQGCWIYCSCVGFVALFMVEDPVIYTENREYTQLCFFFCRKAKSHLMETGKEADLYVKF